MEAIETVTAKETKKQVITADGTKKQFHVKVWNATVANLTLMALGSSAPEILLNVIEVLLLNNFNSGDLGPSTIVGSAAFNLMIITAVCIVCIPAGETRTIDQFYVFLTTAAYSVLAYIWLYIMVLVWTPEVITVAEAVITIIILIVLIIQAYILDRYATEQKKKVSMVCTYPPALKPTTTTTPRPACRMMIVCVCVRHTHAVENTHTPPSLLRPHASLLATQTACKLSVGLSFSSDCCPLSQGPNEDHADGRQGHEEGRRVDPQGEGLEPLHGHARGDPGRAR